MVGITYENVEPAADVRAELGVDAQRLGVWACSGNTPVGLSTLLADVSIKIACAAFCYGLMMDVPGTSHVADAAQLYSFENACAGKTIDDLAQDTPIFIARAGQDAFAHLNDTIDAFVAGALARNMPLTLVNHVTGPHSFDVLDESETSLEIIRRIVRFYRFHLVRD
jgi:hypothetical protein